MEKSRDKRQIWLMGLGLVLLTLAAYSPLWHCGFVLYDDNVYVTGNPMVTQGITRGGIIWAFSQFHAANWHPMTWLSHMLDCQLYELNPWGHHLTSLFLHTTNTVLLFLLLRRMTDAPGPSAWVAALFALHPMHVESVAWVAERKDVLSTFFWLLAVGSYVRYVKETGKWANFHYAGAVLFYALGLMSKPMLVTLPFILILMDKWPLQRAGLGVSRLVVEKIPFFVLSATCSFVTILAQQGGGAISSLARVPWQMRLENVPMAYACYLLKTVWPVRLAVLYPLPARWPTGEIVAAVLLLVLATGWVIWRRRAEPWLVLGWCWFLGMLAPVIGLVHIGSQFMADRYSYLASVGLFIMLVWSFRGRVQNLVGALAAIGCMAGTFVEVHNWTDSETLFRHTLSVTKNNPIIESNLGHLLIQLSRSDEAIPILLKAVGSDPKYAFAHYNLGNAFLAQGRIGDALAQFELQVNSDPADPVAQFNFGNVLLDHGLADDAIGPLQKAAELRPNIGVYHEKLGDAFRQTGRTAEAIAQYKLALKFAGSSRAASYLAWILATDPQADLRDGILAVELALHVIKLSAAPEPKAGGILAAAYAESGDFSKAVTVARKALELAEKQHDSELAEVLRGQLVLYTEGKPLRASFSARYKP